MSVCCPTPYAHVDDGEALNAYKILDFDNNCYDEINSIVLATDGIFSFSALFINNIVLSDVKSYMYLKDVCVKEKGGVDDAIELRCVIIDLDTCVHVNLLFRFYVRPMEDRYLCLRKWKLPCIEIEFEDCTCYTDVLILADIYDLQNSLFQQADVFRRVLEKYLKQKGHMHVNNNNVVFWFITRYLEEKHLLISGRLLMYFVYCYFHNDIVSTVMREKCKCKANWDDKLCMCTDIIQHTDWFDIAFEERV